MTSKLVVNNIKADSGINTVTVASDVTATSFAGAGSGLTSLNAANLGSGTVPTARLGSGTANNTVFLRGDNSWQAIDSSSIKNGNDVKVQANSHGAVVTGIITANSLSIVDGTTSINKHSVGIGTTTTTGRNAGVGTAYGDLVYNTTTDKVQIWHTSNVWYNLDDWSSTEGYYENTTAASSDGLNHYFPGTNSTSVISSLSPNATQGSPVTGATSDSYSGTFVYYNFYNSTNELGWRYTKSGTKWGAGPFSICFWIRPQASSLESESTFVQLGSHNGTRSMYTVSVDSDRKLKAITIGDDTGVHADATLSTGWQHVGVTYNTSRVTKYYINGSLVRSHTHSSALDVGNGTQYIYIGYGEWNSSITNKACMSQMSDIGIWDAKELSATEVLAIHNKKRIIAGY